MKRILILLLLVAGARMPAFSQRSAGGRERIHAVKVAYITDRLGLSSAQSARFWPVYDRYTAELREIRKSFFRKYKNDPGDEVQSRKFIEDNLDYQEQELNLKRKYKDQLLQIISAHQLAQLYQAERDFRKLLIEQLRNKRQIRN